LFLAIGRFTYRWRWPIVLLWAVFFVLAIPILPRVQEPLKVGGFSSPNTEAAQTSALLENELNLSPSTIVIIFQSDTLHGSEAEFNAQINSVIEPARGLPHVIDVIVPAQDTNLISADGRTAYALIGLDLPAEEAQREVPMFRAALGEAQDLDVLVAGAPAFYADIETVSQRDLRRAELIAFPFAMAALLFVFGSVVAASVPLAVGGAGVVAILVTIYGLAHQTDLSIFVLNLATMLGLGLAVDYSLFVTSRFREELQKNGGDIPTAVQVTTGCAGRAIFFSGSTVLIGLSGLILFDFMFLRSVGIAGVVVVFFSVFAALTLLPAILSIMGTNIERLTIHRRVPSADTETNGFWVRLSQWVMQRPVLVMVPTLIFLVSLGAPFRNVEVSSPDATILPRDLPSRQAFDVMVDAYGPGEISPMVIALRSPTTIYSEENLREIYEITNQLAADPRVTRVTSLAPVGENMTEDRAVAIMQLQQGLDELGIDTGADRIVSESTAAILAYSTEYANADESKQLLSEIRNRPAGGDLKMSVGGATADIVDVVEEMYGQFPKAIALVVAMTFVVLLLLFRSLLLPLKAILMNTLSIVASYGALVFIFQDGHFHRLLRFEPLGFVEASLPVIMFCVLFGLSMDYEIFLLSRVREEWDRTHDNRQAVAIGLQKSGRIITSAALIVVVVTASFVSADVILIKALGLGIAIAVTIDASIVRALLVPSTMRLLGKWNWWLPSGLERIIPSRPLGREVLDHDIQPS
jgi:putative drug exporter of the RND superfamily